MGFCSNRSGSSANIYYRDESLRSALSEVSVPLRQMLEQTERTYLLGNTRVKMRTSVENLEVGDFRLDKLSEGENAELPRWVAEELVSLGMAESSEEPFEAELFRALSREKMLGPLQLSALPPDFYARMRRKLDHLEREVAGGRAKREEADKLRAGSYDLIGMRLSKMLSLSSSSGSVGSLADKLTPEESFFFSSSQAMSKEWKGILLGGK